MQSFVSFNNIFQRLTKLTEIQINIYTNSIPRLQFIKCNWMALIFISYNKRKIWLSWNNFFLIWIPSIKNYYSICNLWRSGIHFDRRNIEYYTVKLCVSQIEFIVPQLNTIVHAIRISCFVNDTVIVIHIVSMFGTVLFTNTWD